MIGSIDELGNDFCLVFFNVLVLLPGLRSGKKQAGFSNTHFKYETLACCHNNVPI